MSDPNTVVVTPAPIDQVIVEGEQEAVKVTGTTKVNITSPVETKINVVDTGMAGPPGASPLTGDYHYTHNQGIASASWTVTHNLGKMPSVSVVDSSGNQVEGDILYIDDDTLQIDFIAGFSGKAYIN